MLLLWEMKIRFITHVEGSTLFKKEKFEKFEKIVFVSDLHQVLEQQRNPADNSVFYRWTECNI